jgi:hypothetical protein
MKKALARIFGFAALIFLYLQSHGVAARDCSAPEAAQAPECVEVPHLHVEVPHEEGRNDKHMKDAIDRARDAVRHSHEDVQKNIIDETVKDTVERAARER